MIVSKVELRQYTFVQTFMRNDMFVDMCADTLCRYVCGHICSDMLAGIGAAMCALNLHPWSNTAGAMLVQVRPILQAGQLAVTHACMIAQIMICDCA